MKGLWPHSVRARAAVAAGLAGALLFLAGGLWMRHVVHDERMRATELTVRNLVEKLDVVVAKPWWPEPKRLGTLHQPVGFALDRPVGFALIDVPYPFEVVGVEGTVLASSADLHRAERDGPLMPAPRRSVFRNDRLGSRTVTLGGRTHRVVVGEVYALNLPWETSFDTLRPEHRPTVAQLYVLVPTDPADGAVAGVDRVLLPGVPAAVLLVALVAWLATDRALRPVERMRRQAAEITATDLDRRLQVPGSKDHLARLATTFNDTLDRLAAAAHRQRRFVADAAHELRSPIGNVRAILEVALAVPGGSERDAMRAAAAEARRLHRLADDLLLLSRLEAGTAGPDGTVDLAALVRDQLADRGRVGPVTFALDAAADPVPPVAGDAAHLDRLLANLLDNAERHARTEVRVGLSTDSAGDVLLTVTDDGPGVSEAERERVFDRFARVDDARDRAHGGAGLGLAIGRDICERHGGTLTLAPGDGGARFVARLRRARP